MATHLGIDRRAASSILKKHGVSTRYNLLDATAVQQAAERYRQDLSLAAVAAEFHVAPTTLFNAFQRHGIATRPRRGAG